MMCPLAAVSLVWHVVIAVWLLVALLLIVVVLLQKGRGGGLAAAFGGAGGSSLLGTKTGDFLTWVTIGLVAVFLILSVVMGKFMRPLASDDLLAPPAAVQTMPGEQATPETAATGTKTEEAPAAAQAETKPAEQPATEAPAK